MYESGNLSELSKNLQITPNYTNITTLPSNTNLNLTSSVTYYHNQTSQWTSENIHRVRTTGYNVATHSSSLQMKHSLTNTFSTSNNDIVDKLSCYDAVGNTVNCSHFKSPQCYKVLLPGMVFGK